MSLVCLYKEFFMKFYTFVKNASRETLFSLECINELPSQPLDFDVTLNLALVMFSSSK